MPECLLCVVATIYKCFNVIMILISIMENENKTLKDDDKSPIFGSWTVLYVIVLVVHVTLITLFTLFTKAYS